MKKVIAWLLVLALTAAVSIGATLAYLTDTDEDVNVMTLGKVKIDQLEYERVDDEKTDKDATVQEFHDNKPLIPAVTDKDFNYTPGTSYVDWEQIGKDGYTSDIWDPAKINNEVDKMVFVKNKGDYDAYVRSVFAFEAGKYTTLDQFKQMVHLNLNETDYTWEWLSTPVTIGGSTYFVATATYNKVLAPGALTEISLSQIALDKTATNEDVASFGETYQVLVKSQGIQADGFEDPIVALSDGFGKITANTIPWDNDQPIKGIDVYTALHYLNGDTTGTNITKKVTNVVFGLNKNHAAVAESYDGVLVTDEQDVKVYAYYVPKDTNYDVYFLANDKIYAPKNSTSLCSGMSALKTVDTANLDVSRTQSMNAMFKECGALTSIDVSRWDTSKVTDMADLFWKCLVLPYVDVSNWDVSNVTTMWGIFGYNHVIDGLDVSKWQVGNVQDMGAMFAKCYQLTYLDVSNWDTSSVTTFRAMFQGSQNKGNMKINHLDLSNWDTSNCTVMNHMFYSCGAMTEMDLSGWDVSKVTTMSHMFADCHSVEVIDVSGWNPSSCVDFDGTFNDCWSLKELDTTGWDTGSAVTLTQMFEGCRDLKTIKGIENWDVSKVVSVNEMFYNNGQSMAIEELDLSGWNTASLTNTGRMFMGCGMLTTVYVGDGWNLSQVTGSGSMFTWCGKLIGGQGTTVANMKTDDATYACADGGVDAPGYLTYKAAQKP